MDLVSFWEMAVLNVGEADEKVDNSSDTETGARFISIMGQVC